MNEKIEAITSHTDVHIKGFFGDYRFLSNFEPALVEYGGLMFPSTENAYQAAKTTDIEQRGKFMYITPAESKKLGRKIVIRDDWEAIKLDVMKKVCLYKFEYDKELKAKLLATGTKYLEETNYWKDTFWGVCNGIGQNHLGKILMEIRDELNN